MRYGLLRASFIPPLEQRDWRDLTRDRTTLVQEHRREVNQVQGVLEQANIKLAPVATDIMGVSARAILAALVEGRADPAAMAELAKRRMQQDSAAGAGIDRVGPGPSSTVAGDAVGPYRFPGRADRGAKR
jgi:transposase